MNDTDELERLRPKVGELKSQRDLWKRHYEMLGECVAELEKEADWLATVLMQGCKRDMSSEEDSTDCPATMCNTFCPSSGCSHTTAKDWREAARKAVEENQ